jgi:hypothetical protein
VYSLLLTVSTVNGVTVSVDSIKFVTESVDSVQPITDSVDRMESYCQRRHYSLSLTASIVYSLLLGASTV